MVTTPPTDTEKPTLRRTLFVFVSGIVTNVFWVLCQRRINQGLALEAAFLNFFLSLLAVYVTRSYVQNKFYGLVAAVGFSVGTFITVFLDSHHYFDKVFR
jgi:hypothetical protein